MQGVTTRKAESCNRIQSTRANDSPVARLSGQIQTELGV